MQLAGTCGMRMPKLGPGTWKLRGDEGQDSVAGAIAPGDRHIDTATVYDNEAAVGAGIAASGVRRGEIFPTTKVWHETLTPDAIARSIQTSLGKPNRTTSTCFSSTGRHRTWICRRRWR